MSITRQCELLGVNRSSVYYKKQSKKTDKEAEDRIMDIYMKYPFYGYRRITAELNRRGFIINHKRVLRIMQHLGIRAIYPKPRLSISNKQHKKYPYLLKDLKVTHINQVWASDITYIRLKRGIVYLSVVIDLYSRKVLSHRLSNTLDRSFCVESLNEAILKYGKPDIFNTDQGSQFTSIEFTKVLKENNIKISMNGKGRALDNIFMERTFRSLKYEEVYLSDYEDMGECRKSIRNYFRFFNEERVHQALRYKTPDEVYYGNLTKTKIA